MHEAELRFGRNAAEMEKITKGLLCSFEKYSSMTAASFADIENYLKSRTVKQCVLSLTDLPDETPRPPGPKIFFGERDKVILCPKMPTGDHRVVLHHFQDQCDALILLLAICYIKGLTYPAAYGQLLGFLQVFLVRKGPEFEKCYRSKRLQDLIVCRNRK